METRVISLDKDYIEGISLGAHLLVCGELVAFPTETVYGLGANALDEAAVRRIFDAKGRPADNPLIVHVAQKRDVEALVSEVPALAKRLMDIFWPGPLTIILPKSHKIPPLVSAGLDTVALRMPAHKAALDLIRKAGVPVAAPSANASGRPSPTCATHVLQDLSGRIRLLLDGGKTAYGVESTVVALAGAGIEILRPGGVTAEMLRAVSDRVSVNESVLSPLEDGQQAASPGMAHTHYAPNASVLVVDGSDEQARAALLCRFFDADTHAEKRIFCAEETQCFYQGRPCVIMGQKSNVPGMCVNLFASLREMDAQGVESVYIEGVGTEGMGLALMNRILRAAGFRRVSAQ